ncbi:thioesterase family protein [Amycolatopsis rhabdoformis]|uniref:Thioesterase family protein n=1 Tax=Amycolatopsis rhabdoformis TaxID=1448059 RepID=A0ABZ1HXT5_9PSEU|nr:thioesterase family protein [Amycolatopsis rhabdoformis]WSE26183.1 thioesterase family protein [Amycolatopsis rhabdoformis]
MPTSESAKPAELAGPQTTIVRTVEWHDTDASGHQHNSAVLRWAEEAEASLLRGHGLAWLFGRTPRVRHEVNYRGRLWFGDEVRVTMRVARIGRTSLTFGFDVVGPNGAAADGTVVVVHAEPDSPAATPWPDKVLSALSFQEQEVPGT